MTINLTLRYFGLLILCACYGHAKLIICVVKSGLTRSVINEICPRYDTSNHVVGCVITNDRLSCMRLVVNGVADFYVSEPEDLIIAVENLEYHLMVTHELRVWKNDTVRTRLIAIMHNDLSDISNVRKSKLCYPGLDVSSLSDRDYSSYFEKKLVPKECDLRKSSLENRISSLSHYFEAACIAGTWSLDSTFDTYLKSKYKNLCALCENPVGCYADDKYYGREGALICLTENVGDIAWTRWSSAFKHFTVEDIKSQDFNYLCADGTVRPFTSEKCTWIGEPWPVITARADVAEQVSQLIASMIISNDPFLRLLGNVNFNNPIVQLQDVVTPDTYLQKFSAYADAMSSSQCYPPREVRWCVTSNIEYRKCDTMRMAAYAHNISPQIFCVQESSRKLCMDAVAKNHADLFVINTDEELDARKYGLKPILHMLSNNRDDLNAIGILIKRNTNLHSFNDLKNAKACFAGYKSVGWNAVVAKIINSTNKVTDCSDVKLVSEYFGQSCVYGLNSSNSSFPSKLYDLCAEFKGMRSFDKYQDDPDIMSLKCLSHVGDVAFVNISRAKEVFQQHGKNFAQTYEIFCADEPQTGSNCFLTWTTLGSIMIRHNLTTVLEDEIREMILLMDRLFGQTYYGQTPLFSMYGTYDYISNVIFPEKTKHMHREVSNVRNGKSYSDILDVLISHEKTCNTASPNVPTFITSLMNLILIVYFINKFV